MNLTIVDDGEPLGSPICSKILKIEQLLIYGLIPAVTVILILSFTIKRQKLFPNCCSKRPGFIYPYNGTESYDHRLAVVVSSAVAVRFMMDCLFGKLLIFPVSSPASIKGIWAMLNVLFLGILYYPFIASFTINKVLSYFIGTLYVWLYTAAIIWDMWTYCPADNENLPFHILVLQDAPILLCLLYLILMLPYRLLTKLMQCSSSDTRGQEKLPHVEYVKNLLDLQSDYKSEVTPKFGLFYDWFTRNIYKPIPGFRYSFRIFCSLTVGLLIIYELNITWFFSVLSIYPACALPSLEHNEFWIYISYQCYLSLVCASVSILLSDIIVVFVVYHMLICYRQSLLEMFRGNYRKSWIFNKFNNTWIMVGCILYPGYQTANMIWGFFLQVILVFLLLCIPIQIFAVPFLFSYTSVVLEFFLTLLPIIIISLFFRLLQYLLAKYCFTVRKEQILAIDNRKFLFNFMYFMFFYNIINGLFSSMFRFLKVVIYGVWFFPRLDTSLLAHRFENIDRGYCNYIQFLMIENLQNNPVMVTFLYLLEKKKDDLQFSINTSEFSHQRIIRSSKTIRNRWWLAVTLSRNPFLQLLRSHNLWILKSLQRRFKIQSQILNWELENIKQRKYNINMSDEDDVDDDDEHLDTFVKFHSDNDIYPVHLCWKELRRHQQKEENQPLLIQIESNSICV